MGKRNRFCSDCGSHNLSVYFPTPEPVARQVIELANIHEGMRLLEPSAGTGNLARLCAEKGAVVDCVEIQSAMVDSLRAEWLYRKVWCDNFERWASDCTYDRIVMNPPFENGKDMLHIERALRFLDPDDGVLVAIVSAMTGRRRSRKDREFMDGLDRYEFERSALPHNSFASVGTNVSCDVLCIAV